MEDTKAIKMHCPANPTVHDKVFVINMTPCTHYPVDYQALLLRDYTKLSDYEEYLVALRTKIAFF